MKVSANVLYALLQLISQLPFYTFQNVHWYPFIFQEKTKVGGAMFKNLCLAVSPQNHHISLENPPTGCHLESRWTDVWKMGFDYKRMLLPPSTSYFLLKWTRKKLATFAETLRNFHSRLSFTFKTLFLPKPVWCFMELNINIIVKFLIYIFVCNKFKLLHPKTTCIHMHAYTHAYTHAHTRQTDIEPQTVKYYFGILKKCKYITRIKKKIR